MEAEVGEPKTWLIARLKDTELESRFGKARASAFVDERGSIEDGQVGEHGSLVGTDGRSADVVSNRGDGGGNEAEGDFPCPADRMVSKIRRACRETTL